MRLEDFLMAADIDEHIKIMRKEPMSDFTDGDTFKIVKRADRALYEGYVKGMSWQEWNKIKGMDVDAVYTSWNDTIIPDGIALNIVVCGRRMQKDECI